MNRILLASVAAAALWAAPSFAADPGVPMEEAPVGFSWTGAYVGAQAGYAFGNADYTYDDTSRDYDYRNDPKGFLGGVYAGYNYQFSNNVVLGLEGDFAWTGADDRSVAPGNDAYEAETDIKWSGAVRARLGYAMDRFLPYVAGGFAFAKHDFNEYEVPDFYSGKSQTLKGWTVGAGAEYAFTDNLIFRGEYRFTSFSDKSFTTLPEEDRYEVDADLHDFRVGIAYKF